MKNKTGCSWCNNLKSCLKARPPLVTFTIGIIVLALAFVALALYIRETDDIPNPNFVTDWDSFLSDVSKFKWSESCSGGEDSKSMKNADLFSYGNSTIEICVEVSVDLFNFHRKPDAVYKTAIKGKDLIGDKLPKYLKDDIIILTFSSFNLSKDNSASVYLTVQSNETFLSPKLKQPAHCSPSLRPSALSTLPSVKEVKACNEAVDSAASFSVQHRTDPLLRMYLTVDDKLNIHMHLMSTSYFLLMVALTVLIYGVVKRRVYSSSTSESPNSHAPSNSIV